MTLNGILSTSLSGLFANQTALRATANNVANVNNPDFARTEVRIETQVSGGVKIAGIERIVDEFLETALRTAKSNTNEFTVQREFQDRLQAVLGDPASDSSLAARADQAFASFASLSLNPSDVLRRQEALSEITNFLSQSTLVSDQLQALRSDASQQTATTVELINEQLQRIHALNPLVARQVVNGGDAAGVQSQLATAINSLSELIDIRVDKQSNGTVHIGTSNGFPLVDRSLSQLSYSAPGLVQAGTNFPDVTVSRVDSDTLVPTSTARNIAPNIRSGKLAGLLELRDKQLPNLSEALGELSARVADEFNAIHNAFSAAPPPSALTGKQTLVDGSQATGFTGIVTFAVVDSSNQLVASTTVDFDSAPPADFDALVTQVNAGLGGNATLTLTDGVFSLTAASSTNGVLIADDATAPSQRGGRGFSHFFGMNDLITARQPGIYETGLTGTEAHNITPGETINFKVTDATGRELTTATVTVGGTSFDDILTDLNDVTGLGAFFTFSLDSNGALVRTPNVGFEDVKVEVVSDNTQIANTGLSFSAAFGFGKSFQADAAQNLQIRTDVENNPTLLSLSVFDVAGSVGDVVITGGDQRGALAFQDLERAIVTFNEAGELNASTSTLSQYVSRFLGNAGLQAVRATNFEEDNLALQDEIAQRNSDVSGVNLDEELANLIVYQNAYNAAARILASVQELYDSLLRVV